VGDVDATKKRGESRFSRFSLVFSSLYSGHHSKFHVWHLV
jgi:hypothetical protein